MLEMRRSLAACAACTVLLACTESRPTGDGNSSETHFLTLCSDDGCGDGLICLCGVCTARCDEGSAACAELAAGAECAAVQDGACEADMLCDLTCERDADCSGLSAQHACEDGRCRAAEPARDAGPAPSGTVCEWRGATYTPGDTFLDGDGCNGCVCNDDGSATCTLRGCEPMSEPPCGARDCEYGGVCYADSSPAIPAADGCNTCVCEAGVLSCTEEGCIDRRDVPPCAAGSCEFDGVCYPAGQGTEDGCCTCGDNGSLSCIQPAWCPGRPPIGTRCAADGDCSPGLTCRTDLAGERGVCTRSCNFGCPTGTECVPQVPDYLGGILTNLCMRTCALQADCEGEFGSDCEQPEISGTTLDGRYCF